MEEEEDDYPRRQNKTPRLRVKTVRESADCGCLLHTVDLVSDYISQLHFQLLEGRVFCTRLCILFLFEAHLHSHCSYCLAVLIPLCNIIIFVIYIFLQHLYCPPSLMLEVGVLESASFNNGCSMNIFLSTICLSD